jgi:hypothetical protein
MGTMIRHARSTSLVAPIVPLPVAVVQPSFPALLVAGIGAASLLEPSFTAASATAIALPTIAVRADPEHRVASNAAANPLPENHFAIFAHARLQAGLDNGNRSWQVRTSFNAGGRLHGCQAGTRPVARPGPSLAPTFSDDLTPLKSHLDD